MLRLSELKLPLDHAPDALVTLIARTLDVPLEAIASVGTPSVLAISAASASGAWSSGSLSSEILSMAWGLWLSSNRAF